MAPDVPVAPTVRFGEVVIAGPVVSRLTVTVCDDVPPALVAEHVNAKPAPSVETVVAPQITPVADELLKSVGFKDMNGPGVIDPAAMPQQPEPMQEPIPDMQQMDGGMVGSQTPMADGVEQGLIEQPLPPQ